MRPLPPLRLRLTSSVPASIRPVFAEVQKQICPLLGARIRIFAKPRLTAHRGELFSGNTGPGTAVHAASFIRLRQIVLEEELLANRDLFRLILGHELFHFVWVRLGNPARDAFQLLLADEYRSGARGELGESASVRKGLLKSKLDPVDKTQRWREYACESFCDTAVWFHLRDVPDVHRSLAVRWWKQREQWCELHLRRPLAC